MLESTLFLMHICNAYHQYCLDEDYFLEHYHSFASKKVNIYEPIERKKMDLFSWFFYLKSQHRNMHFFWNYNLMQTITSYEEAFLICEDAENQYVYIFKDHPQQNFNPEKVDSDYWIELYDIFPLQTFEFVKKEEKLIIEELINEININKCTCEAFIEKNEYAIFQLNQYNKALQILSEVAVDSSSHLDFIAFTNVVSKKEKMILQAIRKIEIVLRMGSLRDGFSKGLSEEMFVLITQGYMQCINKKSAL